MGTFTPNINLYKPFHNEVGWDGQVNSNFDKLDTAIGNIDASLVTSVFGRSGAVIALNGDYSFSLISGKAGLAQGGTNADLSGTGGASQVLKQVTVGGAVTVGQLAAADISGLSAIAASGKWSDIQNPSANLTLSCAGNTTEFDQTSGVVWKWYNTTTATSGTTNASPSLNLSANYWTGAASAEDKWTLSSALAAGTNGASQLTFAHSGSSGPASVRVPSSALAGGTYGLGFAGANIGLAADSSGVILSIVTSTSAYPILRFYNQTTGVATLATGTSSSITYTFLESMSTPGTVRLAGTITTTVAQPAVIIGADGSNNGNFAGTGAGTQIGVSFGIGSTAGSGALTFAPASGATNFTAVQINPSINQTGSASGSYTALLVNAVETALLGSANKLLDLQSGSTGGTSVFSVSNAGAVNTTGTFTTTNTMTQINNTTATSGTTNASPSRVFSANYWTGAASAADTWTISSSLAAGTNGVPNLNIVHAGSTGVAQIKAPAVVGIYGWAGGTGGVGPGGGGNINQVGIMSGGSEVARFTGTFLNMLTTTGGLQINTDTTVSRLAAASLAIGNASAGDFSGSLKLTNLNTQGGQIVKRVAKAAGYTSTATDFVITFTATATLTLDSAAAVAGTMYRVKLSTAAAGGSTLTISPNNSKTIEGNATQTISVLGASVDVVYDGSTNWEVF